MWKTKLIITQNYIIDKIRELTHIKCKIIAPVIHSFKKFVLKIFYFTSSNL